MTENLKFPLLQIGVFKDATKDFYILEKDFDKFSCRIKPNVYSIQLTHRASFMDIFTWLIEEEKEWGWSWVKKEKEERWILHFFFKHDVDMIHYKMRWGRKSLGIKY